MTPTARVAGALIQTSYVNDYGAHAENGLDKKFLEKFQSGVGEGAVCTNEAAPRRVAWNTIATPKEQYK